MRIHLMAAVAAVGLLAGTAWAGGEKSAASQSSPAAAQPSSAAAERSGSSASSSSAAMSQAELQQQLGKDIATRSGETIGRLDDIVLDASGKPQKAIIALTDSSKNVAVPFADLQQGSDGWQLKTQTKQQLTAMTSYQHDPSTVSLNHPRGSSGSSSSGSPKSSLPSSTSPGSAGSSANPSGAFDTPPSASSSAPSGSSASPGTPSSRTQP
jgi:hypothetical protein